MKTPYERLGIGKNCDDETVRQAYLEQIRKYPPDRHPEKFQRIQEAFQLIRDAEKRLEYDLFDASLPDMEEFVEMFKNEKKGRRPDRKLLCSLLRESVTNILKNSCHHA